MAAMRSPMGRSRTDRAISTTAGMLPSSNAGTDSSASSNAAP